MIECVQARASELLENVKEMFHNVFTILNSERLIYIDVFSFPDLSHV